LGSLRFQVVIAPRHAVSEESADGVRGFAGDDGLFDDGGEPAQRVLLFEDE
jgi:hypothetical protein